MIQPSVSIQFFLRFCKRGVGVRILVFPSLNRTLYSIVDGINETKTLGYQHTMTEHSKLIEPFQRIDLIPTSARELKKQST